MANKEGSCEGTVGGSFADDRADFTHNCVINKCRLMSRGRARDARVEAIG